VKLVVDASVVVKWFVEEEGQTEALLILERGDECFAPDLVLVEVAGAFDKKLKAGMVTREQALEAVTAIQSKMTMVAGTRLIESAIDLASELGHPVADCLYLACALELDARLVSADKTFVAKAVGRGYGARAFELGHERDEESAQLKVSQAQLDQIKSVYEQIEAAFDNISSLLGRPSRSGRFLDYSPAFDSPNVRRLSNILSDIGHEARLDVIALCWLGRGFTEQNWLQLRKYAASFGDGGLDNTYIISKLHHLQLGIELLEAHVDPTEG
jgi:predicted nucleic acid-binding protein